MVGEAEGPEVRGPKFMTPKGGSNVGTPKIMVLISSTVVVVPTHSLSTMMVTVPSEAKCRLEDDKSRRNT